MAHHRGTVRYYQRVLTRTNPTFSQAEFAAHLHVAINTWVKILRQDDPTVEEISSGVFHDLEIAAKAALQLQSEWRFWPEARQQEAFALHRAMDRFAEKKGADEEVHPNWTHMRRFDLERATGYDKTRPKPPSEERSVQRACDLHLLGWTYTDLAQVYSDAKTPEGEEQRRKWFERAEYCYQLEGEILGEHKLPYLQARAKFARVGARLSQEPRGTAERSPELRAWMEGQGLEATANLLKQERFDFHIRYQALVFASVRQNATACRVAYNDLIEVHPGFEDWSYAPDGTMKCIWSNVDMRFFRETAPDLALKPVVNVLTTAN